METADVVVRGGRGARLEPCPTRSWGTAGTVPHAFVGHGWNRAPRVHEASSRPVASGVEGEAELAGLAVRRVAQAGEGLVDAVVGLADAVDVAGLLAVGDLAAQLVR